jgi:hypothetical protein
MRLTRDRWRRWGALTGIVLALFSLWSGFSLTHSLPSGYTPTTPAATVAAYITANRGSLGGGLFFGGLAAIVLVVFAALLRKMIAETGDGDGLLGRLLFAGAVLSAAVNLAVARPGRRGRVARRDQGRGPAGGIRYPADRLRAAAAQPR